MFNPSSEIKEWLGRELQRELAKAKLDAAILALSISRDALDEKLTALKAEREKLG